MQEMFSGGHKDPCLWQGTAKLQSPFPPPPPTEVAFVANVKLTRCWSILFRGSQGFVRGEGERGGFNQLASCVFSAESRAGDGDCGRALVQGGKMLEDTCRGRAWERGGGPVRFLQVRLSLTAVPEENKVLLNCRSSFLR